MMQSRNRVHVSVGAVVVIVLLGVVALFLAPILTKSKIDASVVLSDARSQMAQVKSYRFTIDAFQIFGEDVYETFTEAEVVFDEGMHVIVRVEGLTLDEGGYSENLLLSGEQYIRSRPDGEWEAIYTGFDPSEIRPLEPENLFQIIEQFSDTEVMEDQEVDGVLSRQIRGICG